MVCCWYVRVILTIRTKMYMCSPNMASHHVPRDYGQDRHGIPFSVLKAMSTLLVPELDLDIAVSSVVVRCRLTSCCNRAQFDDTVHDIQRQLLTPGHLLFDRSYYHYIEL